MSLLLQALWPAIVGTQWDFTLTRSMPGSVSWYVSTPCSALTKLIIVFAQNPLFHSTKVLGVLPGGEAVLPRQTLPMVLSEPPISPSV